MNLPDTFAGGTFDLPPVVAKLVRLAENTDSEPERKNAKEQLLKRGYFLDRAGVLWPKDGVPDFAKEVTDATT
jgi:hypothetical protein